MGYNIEAHHCIQNTSKDGVCSFRLANGICLSSMCTLGLILSGILIYCVGCSKIRLPGTKGIFLLNISISDIGMSLIGLVRGLGIISHKFMGVAPDDIHFNSFCQIYALVLSIFTNSLMMVLVPFTADRFVAVVFPTKYKAWITPRTSLVMVLLSWAPLIVMGIIDVSTFIRNTELIFFQKEYHRCVFLRSERIEGILFLFFPLVAIILMYTVITVIVVKNKIPFTKLLLTSSAIVGTGIMVIVPEILISSFYISMPYEIAQVFTVTLYYSNSVFNPIAYFCTNPRVKEQITLPLSSIMSPKSGFVRRASRLSTQRSQTNN